MTYLERILHDGEDREGWLDAREPVVGASDAAGFAKVESVPIYVDAKTKPRTFSGNETTENGHTWEPDLLAWVGIPQNRALIHHPDEPGFAATPDGLRVIPDSDGDLQLAEIKVKHNKIVTGPTPAEFRQVVWQLFVLPEARSVTWAWGELVKDAGGQWVLRAGSPKKITFWRDDPKIIDVQNKIVPIATAVLAGMREKRALRERAGF
ncbi:hypothetical protein BH09ACT9_BH09ACT9_00170 [soil metagenome]